MFVGMFTCLLYMLYCVLVWLKFVEYICVCMVGCDGMLVCVFVCVCVCVCMCVSECVCEFEHVCVCVQGCMCFHVYCNACVFHIHCITCRMM